MTIWQRLPSMSAGLAKAGSLVTYLRDLAGVGRPTDPRTTVAFTIGLIALSAKMAKSDGVVTSDEVQAFSRLMHVPDGDCDRVQQVFNLAKQDVAGYEAYAHQLADLLAGDRTTLLQVLEGLFVVAAADGVLHEREENYLRSVSDIFSISESDYRYVRAHFVRDAGNPYEILGLSPGADEAEIRARHRTLVLRYHPDKLSGLGEGTELIAAATRKVAAINAAFDTLRKERGF